MRDVLRGWLRVLGPRCAVPAPVALAAWLGPNLRDPKPAGPPDGDASLLVLVKLTRADGAVERHQLLRVPFKGSEPQPPETVWEGLPGYLYQCQVVDGRYVVTEFGVVIDTWEKRELRGAGGNLIDAN